MKRLSAGSLGATSLTVVVVLVTGLIGRIWADEAPVSPPQVQKLGDLKETTDKELRASVVATAKEFAERCEFNMAGMKLTLYPEPILHWTNPTAGTVFGEVYVWTHNGRPMLVASWYHWFSPDWGATLEACSLAEEPVTARIDDVRFWNSDKPGLTLSPLADTEAPATTPAARLGQMRQLAGNFVAHLTDTRETASGVERELRLLKQPIFRYPAANAKATYLDGALFAFVEGTDPEVFLLLEAVKAEDGASWQFGLARMNTDELRVNFRDTTVWSVSSVKDWKDMSTEPYALFKSEHLFVEPIVGGKNTTGTKSGR